MAAIIACTGNVGYRSDCAYNSMNLMGYIPIVGIAIGLFRIYAASQVDSLTPENFGWKAGAITRGFFEIVGLGLLFFIPDIIMTIGRLLCGTHQTAAHG